MSLYPQIDKKIKITIIEQQVTVTPEEIFVMGSEQSHIFDKKLEDSDLLLERVPSVPISNDWGYFLSPTRWNNGLSSISESFDKRKKKKRGEKEN